MNRAFVLGNGKSRQGINLESLRNHGKIYGCNALYREFSPDVLIATDFPIAQAIQESGYAHKNRFHTRRPLPGFGAKSLPKEYKGFSSGPNAIAQACIDGCTEIYLLGFDLGSTNDQFNNVYADTKFYKKITDPPTFAGNWIKQTRTIMEQYSDRSFVRVTGTSSTFVKEHTHLNNLKVITVEQFYATLNI